MTESALAHNADFAKQQLDPLGEAGFHLQLDDSAAASHACIACKACRFQPLETAAQQARLRALGCHLIQGYLNARPMPLAQLLRWLEARRSTCFDGAELSVRHQHRHRH